MWLGPIIAGFTIMLASLAGVFFIWQSAGQWLAPRLKYLTSFALGVFAVTVVLLVVEALELATSINVVVVSLLGGAIFLHFAIRLVPNAHHHHGQEISDCDDGGKHSHIDARRMLLGDAVHNIGDGILLVPAFLLDVQIGIATAGAIFLHELVQEVAEFFVLREAGFSTWGALFRNFLVSATIFIGIALGFYVSDYDYLLAPLLAFSAGGFWYVIVRDLLPDITQHVGSDKFKMIKHLFAVILGIIVMLFISSISGHSHAHEEDEHHIEGDEDHHEEFLL